jgi:hypothetical protein
VLYNINEKFQRLFKNLQLLTRHSVVQQIRLVKQRHRDNSGKKICKMGQTVYAELIRLVIAFKIFHYQIKKNMQSTFLFQHMSKE